MSTKLQINSLAAMERLLGEGPDDEMAVELRKATIIEYERKHVMPTLELRAEALAQCAADKMLCTKDKRYPYPNVLKPELVEAIQKVATDVFHAEAASLIREAVAEAFGTAKMQDQIEAIVNDKMTTETVRELRKRLQEVLLGDK